MGKINILSPNVYNRIAAGEVVDRPYSVVKELVENALDAGATEIEIRIEKGGKSYISVRDNGSGIEYADLQSLFLPHATSKIEKTEDLEGILTLGFRGEAVASISSVSRMRYTTKCKDSECYQISCNGGEVSSPTLSSGVDGTLVEVEDIFYNIPVRYNFMKSDKVEEGDITTFVQRFILSHPTVIFRYYANDKLIAQSFGGGEEEALVSVYGASILKNTYRIETEKHGVKIRGYISNQNFFKSNKSYQSVFLNGRFIVNTTITAAITNAYKPYVMQRQFPFYVLHIDLPSELVDVNVHPNKADVRFADNQIIYGCLYSVINAVLEGNSRALEYVAPTTTAPVMPAKSPVSMPNIIDMQTESAATPSMPFSPPPTFTYEQAKREIEQAKEVTTSERIKSIFSDDLPFEEVREQTSEPTTVVTPPAKKKTQSSTSSDLFFQENVIQITSRGSDDFYEENKRFLLEQERMRGQMRLDVDSCVYKGNLFNTYLIYEMGDDAYLIDQHAAHERLIYDRLVTRMKERKVLKQPMLVPFILNASPSEAIFIEDYMPSLKEIGFDIEETGFNVFTVSAVPIDLQDIALDKFFATVLQDETGLQGIKLEEVLKDKLAMTACKAAVKGGMRLTDDEVKTLLKDMDGNTGLKCPHGRPAVVKLSKQEIEKLFKRIV